MKRKQYKTIVKMCREIVVSCFIAFAASCVFARTENVDGVEWAYRVEGGEAVIDNDYDPWGDAGQCAAIPRSTSGTITIPTRLGGYQVTGIGDGVFSDCVGLERVIIPDTVTRISYYAFSHCNMSLFDTTTIPGVKLVDGWVYSYTDSLSGTLDLTGVRGITDGAYFIFLRGVGAFSDCARIVSVIVPSSLKNITCCAFENCTGLTNVKINDGVEGIGYRAFYGCTNLTSITIPDSVVSIDDEAFHGCKGLADEDGFIIVRNVLHGYVGDATNVIIPENVVRIGANAFEGCANINHITIPGSVTSIGGEAFEGCVNLESVTIGNGVTSIEGFAFDGCTKLTCVTIPDSVTSIGGYAFYGCNESLFDTNTISGVKLVDGWVVGHVLTDSPSKELNLTGARGIADCVFLGGEEITSVIIPDSVTSIGDDAFLFGGTLSDVTVTIGIGVKHIGARAFRREPSFIVDGENFFYTITDGGFVYEIADGNLFYKSVSGMVLSKDGKELLYGTSGDVIIPDGVTSIEDYAFSGCAGLNSVIIPDSVTSIEDYAFEDCTGLTNMTIGSGVVKIGNQLFGDDSFGLERDHVSFVVDDGNQMYKSVDGMLLSKDGKKLLYGTSGDVIIPDGVTSIEDYAFTGSSKLNSVMMPDSVICIGDNAFEGCIGLTNVVISGCARSIGDNAFASCGFASVTIPDSVVSIGNCAFQESSLANVTIGNGVTSIGYGAFSWNTKLSSIAIPDNVTSIWEEAFSGCSGLASVTIGNGVDRIEEGTFLGCCGLRNLTIGSGVVDIKEGAFDGCDGLMQILVDDRNTAYQSVDGLLLTKDGKTLVKGVNGDVTIPNGVTRIEYDAFAGCEELKSVTMPNGIIVIGYAAFVFCEGLTDITIPNSVKSIGDSAFEQCNGLTSVTVPGNVTNIGCFAFGYCTNLLLARVPRALEKMINDENVFSGCPEDLVIEYYDPETVYDIIVGMKTEIDTELVGYAAKGLPSGLTYNSKTGKVSGTAKKPGEYELTFSKNGEADVVVKFVVREEEVSVGCIGLSGGSFVVGVAGSANGIPLEVATETGVKSVSVKNLPPGMKYDAKSGRIVGAPTKAGEFNVAVMVTTKSGAKRTESITISVAASPDDVVGTFNGFVVAPDGEENAGTFQLTVSETGKLAAKVTTAAGTYSFSDVCWDSEGGGIYSAMFETKKGDALSISIDTAAGWNTNQLSGVFAAYGKEALAVSARRNAFGKFWHFTAVGDADSGWVLSYAANAKAADLSVTLNADGSTRVAGKLGQLKVNASGYSDVTGLSDGVIFADFAPVVSVKGGRTSTKCVLSLRTNLWFDRSNNHADGIGTARLVR